MRQTNEETIHRINRPKDNGHRKLQEKEKCRNCNYIHEKTKFKSPSKDKTCFKCNNVGHFRTCCKSVKCNTTTRKSN